MTKKLNFDFVVCGAGVSGMIAAVSAARNGLKTALINDRSVLGGNASSEIGVVIQGSSHHGLNNSVYAKETGLINELRLKLDYAVNYQGYSTAAALDAVFFDFIYNESNIELFLNAPIIEVNSEDNTINFVKAYQMKQDVMLEFHSKLFADCTGDAVVAYKAGAQIMMGSESKADFSEKSAGENYETYTMGNTLYFEIEDMGYPVKYVRPDFAYDVSNMDFIKDIDNPKNMRMLYVGGRFWTLEYGGQVNTISDNEHINLELRKLVFGIWDYIKNSGKYPNSKNFKIKRVHSVAGTRESRRVVGDYVLTETDIDEKREFKDSIAIGGWPMDLHAPKGIYDKIPASAFIPVTGIYNIPFRSLYSKNIKNLLLAGRNISATHIAMSSTRVIGTCGAMGQAIGTAAFICKKYNVLPFEIIKNYINELKNCLIYSDQSMIGEMEYGNLKLEQKFKVYASSESEYKNTNEELEQTLDMAYGLALPIKTEKLNSLKIKIKNKLNKKQILKIRILSGLRPEAYLPELTVKELEYIIPPNFCDYKEITVDSKKDNDSKIYIVLLKNENLSVFATKNHLPGAVTFRYYKERNSLFDHNTCPLNKNTGFIGQDIVITEFNISFKDVLPSQNIFSVSNIFNGYLRPYKHMNLWLSDNKSNQSITIKSEVEHYINEIHILFNDELDKDTRGIIPKSIVKDYEVILTSTNGEKTVKICDNYQRLNIISIKEQIKTININFKSTYGQKNIGVYGIKLI